MKTYFRSNTVYDQSIGQIDREKGIIKNVTLCQTGEARGHDLYLDDPFIEKVVELGNASSVGIKARFGHPNICTTALGTYLGRYKNFRKVDNKAIADLYLDKTSKKSPNGNLFDYVLDLAESNPDMFGASIAFKAGEPLKAFETVNGVEVEKSLATIISLYAADMVDDPAATNGLFKVGHTVLTNVHEEDLAFHASVFLDEHPEIFELISDKPEIVTEFLVNYKSQNPVKTQEANKSLSIKEEITNLKNWISEKFAKAEKSSLQDRQHAVQGELELLKISFESKLSDLEIKYQDKIDQLQSDLNKSKAYPTLPGKSTDPQLSIKNKVNADDSGKVLLQNLPDNAKRKLKKEKF
ncbi:MAG: hypothetical protein KQI35_01170 [Bacteroidetes bacterium]|nr:hypothetical protein [Bacteroidota bacterium]